jgi:hypothetical protein
MCSVTLQSSAALVEESKLTITGIQLPHLDTIANTFLILEKHGRALTAMPDSLSATAAKRNGWKMIISGFRLEGNNKQIAKKKIIITIK